MLIFYLRIKFRSFLSAIVETKGLYYTITIAISRLKHNPPGGLWSFYLRLAYVLRAYRWKSVLYRSKLQKRRVVGYKYITRALYMYSRRLGRLEVAITLGVKFERNVRSQERSKHLYVLPLFVNRIVHKLDLECPVIIFLTKFECMPMLF